MIVPMKHLLLVCLASARRPALEALGRLGALHIEVSVKDSPGLRQVSGQCARFERALRILDAAAKGEPLPAAGQDAKLQGQLEHWIGDDWCPPLKGDPANLAEAILAMGDGHTLLTAESARLAKAIALYTPFGAFEPETAKRLGASGLPVRLFVSEGGQLPGASLVRQLGQTPEGKPCGVAIGPCDLTAANCRELPLPEKSLAQLESDRTQIERRRNEILTLLKDAANQAPALERALEAARETVDFELAAANLQETRESLAWIAGWIPADQIDPIRQSAKDQSWALSLRDPLPEEEPPTLLRPPKLFRPITLLFETLGITPGYREADVSVPFYIFFTIFFAMLVGDAGYGAILLAATVWASLKWRHAPLAPFALMGVFSLATIAWGVLSGVYFGIPSGALPVWMNHPVAKWLSVQDNIMQLCFTLGAGHLILARLWNAVQLYPSTKALAQVGWVGVLLGMYNLICSVVISGFEVPSWNGYLMGASVVLIALFMCVRGEFKEHAVDFGMLPLDVIGCMGDIISYVRLFAVGMASVKVAENFDLMASGLALPMAAKVPAMVLILFLGHGLNLLMGALSILVHAVRLNTLEFSGAKGLTWAGIAYRPFRRESQTRPSNL